MANHNLTEPDFDDLFDQADDEFSVDDADDDTLIIAPAPTSEPTMDEFLLWLKDDCGGGAAAWYAEDHYGREMCVQAVKDGHCVLIDYRKEFESLDKVFAKGGADIATKQSPAPAEYMVNIDNLS